MYVSWPRIQDKPDIYEPLITVQIILCIDLINGPLLNRVGEDINYIMATILLWCNNIFFLMLHLLEGWILCWWCHACCIRRQHIFCIWGCIHTWIHSPSRPSHNISPIPIKMVKTCELKVADSILDYEAILGIDRVRHIWHPWSVKLSFWLSDPTQTFRTSRSRPCGMNGHKRKFDCKFYI